MAVEWFCQVMGSEVGPLSQAQLVDMVRQHQVNPEDLVRRGGSPWVPAFGVKGLFEAASKPPPAESEVTEVAEEPSPDMSPSPPRAEPEPSRVTNAASRIEQDVSRAANESSKDWFCIASGQKRGPVGFDELKALVEEGSLRGRDRVWRGSWPKFQKAAEIDGLEASG